MYFFRRVFFLKRSTRESDPFRNKSWQNIIYRGEISSVSSLSLLFQQRLARKNGTCESKCEHHFLVS